MINLNGITSFSFSKLLIQPVHYIACRQRSARRMTWYPKFPSEHHERQSACLAEARAPLRDSNCESSVASYCRSREPGKRWPASIRQHACAMGKVVHECSGSDTESKPFARCPKMQGLHAEKEAACVLAEASATLAGLSERQCQRSESSTGLGALQWGCQCLTLSHYQRGMKGFHLPLA